MRLPSVVILLLFFLASLASDLLAAFILSAGDNYTLSYQIREYAKQLQGVPWAALFFGIFFGGTLLLTCQDHNRVTKEQVFAFTLVCALIFIILDYGGRLLIPVLASFHVNPILFVFVMAGLFLSLIVWKGLYVKLGGLGVFLSTLLSAGLAIAMLLNLGLPINPTRYYFTIMGTFMALFSAFDRA